MYLLLTLIWLDKFNDLTSIACAGIGLL